MTLEQESAKNAWILNYLLEHDYIYPESIDEVTVEYERYQKKEEKKKAYDKKLEELGVSIVDYILFHRVTTPDVYGNVEAKIERFITSTGEVKDETK